MTDIDQRRPGLSLRGLTATVPDGSDTRVLLDHVDLDVAAGEVLVVTGPSGSGKSTLLALAGLLRRPAEGDILIDGVPTATLSERRRTALRRNHIGIVYQSASLLPALTAHEQLELVGHIDRQRRGEARARADRSWPTSGSPAGPTSYRGSCQAANANASASPGR